MTARPCTCDRFVPRRPYRAGRDCPKCWLFAHRESVRGAWGGDPADATPVDVPRPDMPAADLADLLADRPENLPDGWKLWPATRAAHLLLVERFLAAMPAYPDGAFAGRGAVICGGGKYEASVYVCVKMLRHVGWPHPIQVWHRGDAEPLSDRVRNLPGVDVVDALVHANRAGRPIGGGWEAKSFAVLASPFEEVLFLDADCYPVYDPDVCFEPANNPVGVVTWPDCYLCDHAVHWPTYGVEPDAGRGLNSGSFVLTKRRAWPVLQLANHYDSFSDYYYWRGPPGILAGAFSDQEQFRVALHKLGVPHHRYADRPLSVHHDAFVQAGPGGRPLFVHRIWSKFGDRGDFHPPPRWHPGDLPLEATAWRYFLEWLSLPGGSAEFPDDVPGSWTAADCHLWAAACRGRSVLELGRRGRSTVVAAAAARRLVSLDRACDYAADGWLERYGVRHKVWLRTGEFADLAATSGGPFGACLVAGRHVATAVPHLAPGAIVGVVGEFAAPPDWRPWGRADGLAVYETAFP